MYILGNLSGIQSYLLDVANAHGGQARRLRARSVYLQMLSEAIRLRVQHAASLTERNCLFSTAGKFAFYVENLAPDLTDSVSSTYQDICRFLRDELGAVVRFSLAVSERDYASALMSVQREKLRPWAQYAITGKQWQTEKLVLPPITKPCPICKHQQASDAESETPCKMCESDERTGKRLTTASALTIDINEDNDSLFVADLFVRFHDKVPSSTDFGPIYMLSDDEHDSAAAYRTITRHVPRVNDISLDFDAIAENAKGRKYLGILKMDADGLGAVFSRAATMKEIRELSLQLEQFFSKTVNDICRESHKFIYIIYGGGDDLLAVGAWNQVIDFAWSVQKAFRHKFDRQRLTLSAGMATIARKTPIKQAVERAEELLMIAKHDPAAGHQAAGDQIAVLGGLWKWSNHSEVILASQRLAQWIESGVENRHRVYTLLKIAESRKSEQLAHARLEYQIARNYRNNQSASLETTQLREWMQSVSREFMIPKDPVVRNIEAVLRYALMATAEEN